VKVLYFDCFSGASGDMVVGALIDAGVPLDEIRGALGSLSIDEDAVWTERVQRAGIGATKFQVRGEDGSHAPHHHAHAGGVATEAHAHRTLPEIYTLIDGSRLSATGKERAKALFARLARSKGPFTAPRSTKSISTRSDLSIPSSTSSARYMRSSWSVPIASLPRR